METVLTKPKRTVNKKSFRKKKKQLTSEQKQELEQKKIKNKFCKNIESIFINSGFESYKTEGTTFSLGLREHELDHLFKYENIIILCERTTGKKDKDHIRKKKQTIDIIIENKEEFITYLGQQYPSMNINFYNTNRYIIKYLYFSMNKIELSYNEESMYAPIKFVSTKTFNYFLNISSCLKKSSIFEIFKFLNISKNDVGIKSTRTNSNDFNVTILHPVDVTGLNEVRMVSFMISPGDVIENAYVLRKDNWDDSMDLYQRMVTKKRISDIRKFIVKNKKTFFNNIILSLPSGVLFKDGDKIVNLNEMDENKCYTMVLKNEYNSIGIIDGQHRVYAHYQNNIDDNDEKVMSILRNQLNLLATGIIFPEDLDVVQKRKFESELFLEINKNPQKVKSELIMYIEMSKNPYNDASIAREILVNLNDRSVLAGLFQMSSLEKAPIKMTSIIKYALKSLISTNDEQETLFKYWSPQFDKNLVVSNMEYRKEYIRYCTNILSQYFSAIKNNYASDFEDKKSMILKVVAINGFIIGLRLSLELTGGPQDYSYYNNAFSQYRIEFSKEKFGYAGSRYAQFAENVIVEKVFKGYIDNIKKQNTN